MCRTVIWIFCHIWSITWNWSFLPRMCGVSGIKFRHILTPYSDRHIFTRALFGPSYFYHEFNQLYDIISAHVGRRLTQPTDEIISAAFPWTLPSRPHALLTRQMHSRAQSGHSLGQRSGFLPRGSLHNINRRRGYVLAYINKFNYSPRGRSLSFQYTTSDLSLDTLPD